MWYYYVAFITGEGRLKSCRIDSKKELSTEERAVEIPKALYGAYGSFTCYECVLSLQDPRACILVQGGSVSAVLTSMPGLLVEVFDLDLVNDGTTAKEQEIRSNLSVCKVVEVEVTNHYEKHG